MGNAEQTQTKYQNREDTVFCDSNYYRPSLRDSIFLNPGKPTYFWLQCAKIVDIQKVGEWTKFTFGYYSSPFYFRGDIYQKFYVDDIVAVEYFAFTNDPNIYIFTISLQNKYI